MEENKITQKPKMGVEEVILNLWAQLPYEQAAQLLLFMTQSILLPAQEEKVEEDVDTILEV